MLFLPRASSLLAFVSFRGSIRRFSSTCTHQKMLPEDVTVLQYDYVPDVLEKRGPYREEHLSIAKDMISTGTCLAGGPFVMNESPAGAFFWFTSAEAAREFVEKDPYVTAGIVTAHKIMDWSVVVQKEK